MRPPLVIGHRGAPGYRPEHTRSSFLLAIEQGAQAIEVDVVPAGDGALAVRHEHALRATTDVADRPEFAGRAHRAAGGRREWFAEDFTGQELTTLHARERLPGVRPQSALHDDREPVLLLADVLALAAEADVLLVVEVKDATRSADLGLDVPQLLATTLAAQPRLPRLTVESFEKAPLRALAPLGLPLVYLVDAVGTAEDERRRIPRGPTFRQELAAARFEGLAGVSLPTSLVTSSRVAALHAAGLQVWTWTLRPENPFLPPAYRRTGGGSGDWRAYWNALLDTGVDGVFTDHPDLTTGLVAARAATTALQL
ncbi:glycerophosphodiester phosphodiesterase family protein [Amnibacterium endophyticum]|uniref:glycerophosphodiester phosphodiesterase n=1 Tax=Amnibacterium endophyticum TaxID=2109337 RepID=A0ABW4LCW6_9MICO